MMHTQGNAAADEPTEQQHDAHKKHGRCRGKWNRTARVLTGLVGLGAFMLLWVAPLAIDTQDLARVVELKNKAHSIGVAVVSLSMERESPWPSDVVWGNPPKAVQWDSASQYFRYLMSDDKAAVNPLRAIPTENAEERLATDLTPILIAWAGIPAAPSAAEFDDTYCA